MRFRVVIRCCPGRFGLWAVDIPNDFFGPCVQCWFFGFPPQSAKKVFFRYAGGLVEIQVVHVLQRCVIPSHLVRQVLLDSRLYAFARLQHRVFYFLGGFCRWYRGVNQVRHVQQVFPY